MKAKERIIFALDFPSFNDAKPYIDDLKEHVGLFKVGLELFLKEGRTIIDYINKNTENQIFLDLKLLDIPKTVERSVRIVSEFDVRFLTIHAVDRQTLDAAVKGADGKLDILGVTVMTSLDSHDLKEQGIDKALYEFPEKLVEKRIGLSYSAGCSGVICSPRESFLVKKKDPDFFAVTPGVRMAHNNTGDQKRVSTPYDAVKNGSDYIVVGRPVRDADNPESAAKEIALDIERVVE